MSSSNIIKHHRLQKAAVMVGSPLLCAISAEELLDAERGSEPWDRAAGGQHDAVGAVRRSAISGAGRPDDMVEKAKKSAEAMLREAAGAAEEAERAAREQGYRDGYAEGLAAAKAESNESVARLAALASGAVVDIDQLISTTEEAVVKLALAIAEKVVYKSASDDRALVVSMVRGALEHVDVMDVVRIRVHPDDLEVLRPYWSDGYLGNAGRNWELMPDPRVQLGGCIIDTNNAVVDAQLETKLAEIEKAFWAEFKTRVR